jgi:hypothetical protein
MVDPENKDRSSTGNAREAIALPLSRAVVEVIH